MDSVLKTIVGARKERQGAAGSARSGDRLRYLQTITATCGPSCALTLLPRPNYSFQYRIHAVSSSQRDASSSSFLSLAHPGFSDWDTLRDRFQRREEAPSPVSAVV